VHSDGEYVLYWMTAFRRADYNFAMQRAADWAHQLGKPLVVLEALNCDYRWASDRLHRFVIQGMAVNQQRLAKERVLYYPYVEPRPGAGKGLVRELARRASVVVGDDFPCFFLPRIIRAAAEQIPVRFEVVDANGLLPMRAADKVFLRAFDLRRFLQKNLLPHLADTPKINPFSHLKLSAKPTLPESLTRHWPRADLESLLSGNGLAGLPIDHSVQPVATQGGAVAANKTLKQFLNDKLAIYDSDRNQPERDATSGLSPYLHFGHISVHQVFEELTSQAQWTPELVADKASGSSRGWWGASPAVEGFLDQIITWRELGYNLCSRTDDYDRFESLPEWAQDTLENHANDKREHVYSLAQFEQSRTHDPLWNAAQRQLVREGWMHNYLRMLWGKKILEWSDSPRTALDVMIELNNKYALDGRNPNSYSGIFWVLGRYDRPWGPERPIYGKIRYMTSENTARKVKVKGYMEWYSGQGPQKSLGFG
jgi:deoxyribodipyrimidine photo-lyase